MSRILAIDPGTEQSGFVVWDNGVVEADTLSNEQMLNRIIRNNFGGLDLCGIEMVASYGMAVGKEIFETVFWIGRFYERAYRYSPTTRVFRKDVKIHICGTAKAKDANIRQALIDKHGPTGSKNNRGPLYGISGHLWSALAVADYLADNQSARNPQ